MHKYFQGMSNIGFNICSSRILLRRSSLEAIKDFTRFRVFKGTRISVCTCVTYRLLLQNIQMMESSGRE